MLRSEQGRIRTCKLRHRHNHRRCRVRRHRHGRSTARRRQPPARQPSPRRPSRHGPIPHFGHTPAATLAPPLCCALPIACCSPALLLRRAAPPSPRCWATAWCPLLEGPSGFALPMVPSITPQTLTALQRRRAAHPPPGPPLGPLSVRKPRSRRLQPRRTGRRPPCQPSPRRPSCRCNHNKFRIRPIPGHACIFNSGSTAARCALSALIEPPELFRSRPCRLAPAVTHHPLRAAYCLLHAAHYAAGGPSAAAAEGGLVPRRILLRWSRCPPLPPAPPRCPPRPSAAAPRCHLPLPLIALLLRQAAPPPGL